jgi:hypothetical protein
VREHGTSLEAATRGDLEAFLGDLLSRRKASTAATFHKVLNSRPAGPTRPVGHNRPVAGQPANTSRVGCLTVGEALMGEDAAAHQPRRSVGDRPGRKELAMAGSEQRPTDEVLGG